MSRLKKYAGLAVLLAIVAALGISSIASAQGATPVAPTSPMAHGWGFGRGINNQVALDAAAKALGMTSDELSAQLWGGKTLAQIADEKGVDILTVQKAVQAALQDATKTAIQDAVKAGTLTQDKADWLLQGLDKGYWGAEQGLGFGFGFGGRGGFHGRGGFGAPKATPPNSNGSSTNPSGFRF